MEVQFRDIQLATERDVILEFHCYNNYQSESSFYQSIPYDEYRESWLKSPQPEEVLLMMEKDIDDSRNLVQFILVNDEIAGFLWVKFKDIDMTFLGAKETHAVVYGLSVRREFQKKGIGTEILAYIERDARKKGASLVRSGAGAENVASQRLHEAFGFKVYYMEYEKEV